LNEGFFWYLFDNLRCSIRLLLGFGIYFELIRCLWPTCDRFADIWTCRILVKGVIFDIPCIFLCMYRYVVIMYYVLLCYEIKLMIFLLRMLHRFARDWRMDVDEMMGFIVECASAIVERTVRIPRNWWYDNEQRIPTDWISSDRSPSIAVNLYRRYPTVKVPRDSALFLLIFLSFRYIVQRPFWRSCIVTLRPLSRCRTHICQFSRVSTTDILDEYTHGSN